MKTIVKRVSVQLVKESAHKYDVPRQLLSPYDARDYIKSIIDFDAAPSEMFIVVPVDVKNRPLSVTIVTKGLLDVSLVHAREVFQTCILSNAYGCFIFHNHPSGDPSPSREDASVTKKLVDAGHILDIPVIDHIIIGDGNKMYSFRNDYDMEEIRW